MQVSIETNSENIESTFEMVDKSPKSQVSSVCSDNEKTIEDPILITGLFWTAEKIVEFIEGEFAKEKIATQSSDKKFKIVQKKFKILVDSLIYQHVLLKLENKFGVWNQYPIMTVCSGNIIPNTKIELENKSSEPETATLVENNVKTNTSTIVEPSNVDEKNNEKEENNDCFEATTTFYFSDESPKTSLYVVHYDLKQFEIEIINMFIQQGFKQEPRALYITHTFADKVPDSFLEKFVEIFNSAYKTTIEVFLNGSTRTLTFYQRPENVKKEEKSKISTETKLEDFSTVQSSINYSDGSHILLDRPHKMSIINIQVDLENDKNIFSISYFFDSKVPFSFLEDFVKRFNTENKTLEVFLSGRILTFCRRPENTENNNQTEIKSEPVKKEDYNDKNSYTALGFRVTTRNKIENPQKWSYIKTNSEMELHFENRKKEFETNQNVDYIIHRFDSTTHESFLENYVRLFQKTAYNNKGVSVSVRYDKSGHQLIFYYVQTCFSFFRKLTVFKPKFKQSLVLEQDEKEKTDFLDKDIIAFLTRHLDKESFATFSLQKRNFQLELVLEQFFKLSCTQPQNFDEAFYTVHCK